MRLASSEGLFSLTRLIAGCAVLPIALVLGAPAAKPGVGIERHLVYRHVGVATLTLDAYLPPPAHGLRAAVVFVHGGGWRAGDKTAFAPGQQAFAPTALRLVRAGFAVFSIDYRLAPKDPFPAAVSDVRAAVEWLRMHAASFHVDPRRLALFGASAGGNLAALAATEGHGSLDRGARVRAAVSWSGAMDLRLFDAELGGPARRPYVESYLGCPPTRCPDRYKAASPVTHVDSTDPPILIANGTDEIVPFAQAVEMAGRLAAANVPHRLLVIRGSRHAADYEAEAWRATVRFLLRYLR